MFVSTLEPFLGFSESRCKGTGVLCSQTEKKNISKKMHKKREKIAFNAISDVSFMFKV